MTMIIRKANRMIHMNWSNGHSSSSLYPSLKCNNNVIMNAVVSDHDNDYHECQQIGPDDLI
jgi:hypothetical protein